MLDPEIKSRLIQAAIEARQHAYAPYSGNFKVGAAVITGEGKVFSGCNIENASFGATVCAERVAIFKAISDGPCEIVALAVVADLQGSIAPCGICLQVMSEFGRSAEVVMANLAGETTDSNTRDLLPSQFRFPSSSAEDGGDPNG